MQYDSFVFSTGTRTIDGVSMLEPMQSWVREQSIQSPRAIYGFGKMQRTCCRPWEATQVASGRKLHLSFIVYPSIRVTVTVIVPRMYTCMSSVTRLLFCYQKHTSTYFTVSCPLEKILFRLTLPFTPSPLMSRVQESLLSTLQIRSHLASR